MIMFVGDADIYFQQLLLETYVCMHRPQTCMCSDSQHVFLKRALEMMKDLKPLIGRGV